MKTLLYLLIDRLIEISTVNRQQYSSMVPSAREVYMYIICKIFQDV